MGCVPQRHHQNHSMYLRPLQPRTKPKPPSLNDAFSSRTRWKLLGAIFALFLVLKLIEVVREPQAWHWFFRMNGIPVPQETLAEDIPDPRLPFQPEAELPDGTFVVRGEKPIIEPNLVSTEVDTEAASAASDDDPLPRVWREAWRDIYRYLEFHERSTLYRALKSGRDGTVLPEEFRKNLQDTIAHLDRGWSAYQAEATAALTTVPDEEKPLWLDLLRRTGNRWQAETQADLLTIAEGKTLDEDSRAALKNFQALLDMNLLREVEDDTVWRANETEISFRLFEQVQEVARGKQTPPEVQPVSYLQLFKQSQEYRGKWVSISGVAREAWHVRSSKNWLGIDGYYVFVIKPNDVNSPFFVYTLELPPGFPPVKDKDIDGERTPLNDPMEFTGLYLKRWAYVGQDGTYTAPLLIAKAGSWTAPPKPFGGMGESTIAWMPQIIGWMLTTLFLGAALFWYFRPRPAPRYELPDQLGPEIQSLDAVPVPEQLRQLEQRHQAE